MLVPSGDQNAVIEVLEDIEELNQCYSKLGIDKVKISSKKAKLDDETIKERKEAQTVLLDFLTSLLTKPQAFLREVANLCFKNFCVQALDSENLQRLLTIVSTPNHEAGEFMEGAKEQELQSDDEEVEDDEESEASSGDDIDE